jgi:drug/metabolite transporter (DMT)-like permease
MTGKTLQGSGRPEGHGPAVPAGNCGNPSGGRLGADLFLLSAAFFWGLAFPLVKEALSHVSVLVFLGQRFALAFLLLFPLCLFRFRNFRGTALRDGALLGVFLFAAFFLQTAALRYTTATNAAFLTGLSVVFVALLGARLFRHRIHRFTAAGVFLAAAGLFLLTTGGQWRFNGGDFLALLCALSVAFHVLYTGAWAPRGDVYWLTTVQMGTIALLCALFAVLTGDGADLFRWHGEILGPLVVCSVFATVFAFLIQTAMQRFTPAAHTALIFCMEPVFGAVFAFFLLGERMGAAGMAGAFLIFTGMVLSEVPGILSGKRNGKVRFT